jgi:hypothetical protein
MRNGWIKFLIFILAVGSAATVAHSQAHYDSSYVESYRGFLMPRLLVSRKTTGMNYHNATGGYSLRYQPNKTFSLGAGITYKFITLKASVGLVEPHQQRGNTRDLDLQFHSYGKKFATDLLMQFYKGFYLPDRRFGTTAQEYYVRPDLAVSALGGSFQYIFNHRRYSYRAAFQQTEWQKRSAGTMLVGMEVFMGRFRADSTIVPSELQHGEADRISKMRFIEFGPNVGYAYTWVYKKFFINTGASLGINAGLNRFYEGDDAVTFTGLSPNTVIKISSGYSVKHWGINVLYISTALRVPEFEKKTVVLNTGTIRMNLIYRIYPDKKTRRLLKPIDSVEKRLKD